MGRRRRRLARLGMGRALLAVAVVVLMAAPVANAYWYWYTSAGNFAGVANGDTRNSGNYSSYMGETTNQTTGTRKIIGIQIASGGGYNRDSIVDGNPRVFKWTYPNLFFGKNYYVNNGGGAANVQCGWNT